MDIRILGPIRLGGRAWKADHRKPRSLIELLLVNANKAVSRDLMVEYLWDDAGPPNPRKTLNVYLSRARRLVDRDVEDAKLWTNKNDCVLELAAERVDYHRSVALIEKGNKAAARGDHAEAVRHLEPAVALWRDGRPLDSADTSRAHRMREDLVNQDLLPAYRTLFSAKLALGDHEYVLRELRDVQQERPHDETLAGLWMRALHAASRTRDIPDFHRAFIQRLKTDLDTGPSPQLLRLYDALVTDDTPPVEPGPALADLPRDTPYFTGREDLLRRLDDAAAQGNSLVTIDGPGGVGKSALIVRWVRTRMDRFPDGVLYKNLQGFTPDAEPLDPTAVLADFLTSLRLPRDELPTTQDDLVARLRALLSGKRLVVVLDNVRDAAHARPLLAATTPCHVIISSRQALTGLALSDNAHLVTVPPLSHPQQITLLATRLGDRMREDPAAARKLAVRTDGLPLALLVVAEHVAARPSVPLRELAAQLSEAHRVLNAGGHGDTNLRSVLSVTLEALDEPARHLFDLIGLHPLPLISGSVAKAMTGTGEAATEHAMDRLLGAHLMRQTDGDHYRVHDLIHMIAAERSVHLGTAQDQARRRMIEWYLLSAAAARDQAVPDGVDVPTLPLSEGVTPLGFDTAEAALHWFATERANLMAIIRLAARHRYDDHVWRLTAATSEPLRRLGYLNDALVANRLGISAAEAAGNVLGEAGSTNNLGLIHEAMHDNVEAIRQFERAFDLFVVIGHIYGQAASLHNVARIRRHNGDLATAAEHATRSLELLESVKAGPWATARVHRSLGELAAQMGDHQEALHRYHRALSQAKLVDDVEGKAATMTALAELHLHGKELPYALDYGRSALTMHSQAMNRAGTARTLLVIADAQLQLDGGGTTEAVAAVGAYRELGDDLGLAEALELLGRCHSSAGAHELAARSWATCADLLSTVDPERAARVAGWVRAAQIRAGHPVPEQHTAAPVESAEPTRPMPRR
ncbi:AfsR/SARP family transcriptional regulator [Actinokineospora inagensis]|uniref:AfsR/SARP family transcriptional regulator n=1 Tax=Actinokineospora inagensis TaxID=103730 RepID=UPI000406410C|nr:BTAD domain-containing putative transcriptional regulator [Actinokineospora inagensis]